MTRRPMPGATRAAPPLLSRQRDRDRAAVVEATAALRVARVRHVAADRQRAAVLLDVRHRHRHRGGQRLGEGCGRRGSFADGARRRFMRLCGKETALTSTCASVRLISFPHQRTSPPVTASEDWSSYERRYALEQAHCSSRLLRAGFTLCIIQGMCHGRV
jgi:hypothetical protein